MTGQDWIISERGLTDVAPHRQLGSSHQDIVRSWIIAASCVGGCGVMVYGPAALNILLISVAIAVATHLAMGMAFHKTTRHHMSSACLTGLLFGLTLPATAPWYVAVIGSLIAISVGRGVFDGFLHPALIGRVVVQFLFSGRLSLAGALALSPVLTPGHLLTGDIMQARPVLDYQGWQKTATPYAKDAFLLERPVQALRRFAEDGIRADGESEFLPLLRDTLPPWRDTIFGVVPGGIGETPTLMLIIMGLYLIYRGFLRWQLPVTILASAAVAAALLPVELGGDYRWFPILEIEQHQPVGVIYVFYHLTAGQLMLGAFLLAGDVIATPMRVTGQLIFAAGVGVLTIFMRLYGVLGGECYWSILIMNVLVGAIDRRIKRPVLGLAT